MLNSGGVFEGNCPFWMPSKGSPKQNHPWVPPFRDKAICMSHAFSIGGPSGFKSNSKPMLQGLPEHASLAQTNNILSRFTFWGHEKWGNQVDSLAKKPRQPSLDPSPQRGTQRPCELPDAQQAKDRRVDFDGHSPVANHLTETISFPLGFDPPSFWGGGGVRGSPQLNSPKGEVEISPKGNYCMDEILHHLRFP